MSPEMTMKITVWRQKALDGTLSLEECKEAILFLREARLGAASTQREKVAKAKVAIPNAMDLLSGMMNL